MLYFDEILPNLLSNNEVLELIKKAKNGDIEARNKIIEHNIRLIVHIVNSKFNISENERDDYYQTGVFGVIRAIDKFDFDRNVMFSTFAAKCIFNVLYEFACQNNKNNKVISLNVKANINSDSNEELISILKSDENIESDFIDRETINLVREAIEKIPNETDKKVIKMYYGINHKRMGQREIAKLFNCSPQNISLRHLKGINSLKGIIIKEGIVEVSSNKLVKRIYL